MSRIAVVMLLVLIVTVANAEPSYRKQFWHELEHEFDLFKTRHGKLYSDHTEHDRRKNAFFDNKHQIRKSNKLFKIGKISFKSGTNEFSDISNKEFNSVMNGYKRSNTSKPIRSYALTSSFSSFPSSVDWRRKGAVTPVKSQQQCRSCWAFSAAGALEAQMFKKTGHLESLSAQNLIDCSVTDGNHGCDGGCAEIAFDYVRQNAGIDTDASYPYTGTYGKCHYSASSEGFTVEGFVEIPHGNESALTSAVFNVGPVAAAIDASRPSFQHYRTGIYDDPTCNANRLTHTVLIVGYGSEGPGRDYYIDFDFY